MLQFAADVTNPPPDGETPAACFVRRGDHAVSLPSGHALVAPLASCVVLRGELKTVPYFKLEGLFGCVARVNAGGGAAVFADAKLGHGGLSLGFIDTLVDVLGDSPYSVAFESHDDVSLLRTLRQLRSSDRLLVDARVALSASDIYKFQPRRPVAPPRGARAARARPRRSVPAAPRRQRGRSDAQHAAALAAHAALVAAAAAAADDDDEDEEEDDPDDEAPLTDLQLLARLVGDEPWPSEGSFLGPYADLRLFLGDAVLAEDRWDAAKQFTRVARQMTTFVRSNDAMAAHLEPDELVPHAIAFFARWALPAEMTNGLLVSGRAGVYEELSDRAKFSSSLTRGDLTRARFAFIVSALATLKGLLAGASAAEAWALTQRLLLRLSAVQRSAGPGDLSSYIALEAELKAVEDMVQSTGVPADDVAALLTFFDDRGRRRMSSPDFSARLSADPSELEGGASWASSPAASFAAGSELSTLLSSATVAGLEGVLARLRLASPDPVLLLKVAVDSRLSPMWKHVFHKRSSDPHEIFTLVAPAIASLPTFLSRMLSTSDDDVLCGAWPRESYDLMPLPMQKQINDRAKSFSALAASNDAKLLDDLKRGYWQVCGTTSTGILMRLFALYDAWLIHFLSAGVVVRPTTLGELLQHDCLSAFAVFADRAFSALGYPRHSRAPSPGIESILQTAAASAKAARQLATMSEKAVAFVADLVDDASASLVRYRDTSLPSTAFPGFVLSSHYSFASLQTSLVQAANVMEMQLTCPSLAAAMRWFEANPGASPPVAAAVQVVNPPPKSPTPVVDLAGAAAAALPAAPGDDAKLSKRAQEREKKRLKLDKAAALPAAPRAPPAARPAAPQGAKPGDNRPPPLPGSWKAVFEALPLSAQVPGCCSAVPVIANGYISVLWGTVEQKASQAKMAAFNGCKVADRCWACCMSTHANPACRLSVCLNPTDPLHQGPNAPAHQKKDGFDQALRAGDFR